MRAPPQRQLADYVVESVAAVSGGAPPPPGDFARPPHWDAVESAIAAAALRNGLAVDTATASNGDCGVDALLRNIERLHLGNQASKQVLSVLQRRGREAALLTVRLQLLIWIRDHRGLEILPGMTLEKYVSMELSHPTLEAYIS